MGDGADEWAGLRARLAGLRYLLVATPPFRRDASGRVWLDPLWHRDLAAHLLYISDLTVLAPRLPMPEGAPGAVPGGLVAVDAPGLRFVEMPDAASLRRALPALPRMARAAWGAVRDADVVHGGVAGWPVPAGLLVNPFAVLRRRPLVFVVESAFWRTAGPGPNGGPHGRAARLRAGVTERLARWSAARAALGVYTQDAYLRDIGGRARGARLLTPASLLDDGDVLTAAEAGAAWDAKGTMPRFVLAARLERTKGVGMMLDALRLAEAEGHALDVTVIGEGTMAGEVDALAAGLRVVRLARQPPVPYGPGFLELLGGFHAVLVPSLTDEQPRILLDAGARAVPAIASDTDGHRGLVAGAGWLVPPGDAPALLAAMLAATPADLRARGLGALAVARGRTREAMHLARARALADALGR